MRRDDWQTPKALFEYLHSFCKFTVDAAASEENALLHNYWDEAKDALKQDWSKEIVFCNPPYSRCKEFADHARENANQCVLLLPVRSDRIWYQKLKADDLWQHWDITGRLHFDDSGKSAFMYSVLFARGMWPLFSNRWVDASRFNLNGKGGAKS